jgi:hypothetical protein
MKNKNEIKKEPKLRFSAFDTYLRDGLVRIDPKNSVISMESSCCAMVTMNSSLPRKKKNRCE